MKKEGKASIDQTINSLIDKSEKVPETMFGMDKTRKLKLGRKEHEEFQRSHFS